MGIFNETFGEAGTAQAFFGGEWWLVGLLLLTIIIFYFYSKGVSIEGLVIIIFSGILFLTMKDLFSVSQDIIMTIIVFLVMSVALLFYLAVGR